MGLSSFNINEGVKLFQNLRGASGNFVINVKDAWMSEKYDGVRAFYIGHHQLVTCKGQRIDAPDWFFRHFPEGYLFDGELWLSNQNFDCISGLVRRSSANSPIWQSVKYLVFDVLAQRSGELSIDITMLPFEKRQIIISKLLPPFQTKSQYTILDDPSGEANVKYNDDSELDDQIYESEIDFKLTSSKASEMIKTVDLGHYIYWIPQYKITNLEIFQKYYGEILGSKGEGIVVIPRESIYSKGQKNSYKLKDVDEIEAVVIGYKEGNGKNIGKIGSFTVLKVSSEGEVFPNQKFSIGSGLSQYHRDHGKTIYPIGTVLTCHYSGLTSGGIPRFPRLKGVRTDIIVKKF